MFNASAQSDQARETMLRDELLSVLDLGWEASRKAWSLLESARVGVLTPSAVGWAGTDFDRLAYDLRQAGHDKPARLAFSVAFIMNGLASRTLQFDPELAETASQIVKILAEMLLELEATSQVTIEEPLEIVEHLKTRWGIEAGTAIQPDGTAPSHFIRSVDEIPPVSPVTAVASPDRNTSSELVSISEELVRASESLLNRVLNEGGFPHTASLGRIHHLGTTIRDRVALLPMSISQRTPGLASDSRNTVNRPLPAEPSATFMTVPPVTATSVCESAGEPMTDTAIPQPTGLDAPPTVGHRLADRTPNVLIIEESPFFRMLLKSAIEAAGYTAKAVSRVEGTQSMIESEPWDLVLCSEESVTGDCGLTSRLLDHAAASNTAVIALSTGREETGSGPVPRVSRKDIAGLLTLIRTKLGPATSVLRISA